MTINYFKHPQSIVETEKVGEGTRIWAFAHVLPKAIIGPDCNICDHVFIENDVVVGARVTIKSGAQLWDGIRLEDDVFVGPNATFTNHKFPRSKGDPPSYLRTVAKKGASIGANATILPGLTIGTQAMIGAGAVVTHDVPPRAIVVGNPARIVGYVDTPTQPMRESEQHPIVATPTLSLTRIHELKHVTDLRGDLCVAELEKDIPFEVRRIFFVYDVPSTRVRGEHVHKTLHEFLICLRGSVSVVATDGKHHAEYCLDKPWLGLYMPPRIWRTLYKFSPDAILAVFASHDYDPSDYIRDYDEFLALVSTP
jgi:UDP-2-acetamido-3-amino-2,3-dideoxy-glucuronate N-acetyltransferase